MLILAAIAGLTQHSYTSAYSATTESIFYYDFYDAWIADGSSMFGVYEQFHESYLLDSGNYTLIAEQGPEAVTVQTNIMDQGWGGYGGRASYNLQFNLSKSASTFNVIPAPGAILLAGSVQCLWDILRRCGYYKNKTNRWSG
jgi:hypothetical protein